MGWEFSYVLNNCLYNFVCFSFSTFVVAAVGQGRADQVAEAVDRSGGVWYGRRGLRGHQGTKMCRCLLCLCCMCPWLWPLLIAFCAVMLCRLRDSTSSSLEISRLFLYFHLTIWQLHFLTVLGSINEAVTAVGGVYRRHSQLCLRAECVLLQLTAGRVLFLQNPLWGQFFFLINARSLDIFIVTCH